IDLDSVLTGFRGRDQLDIEVNSLPGRYGVRQHRMAMKLCNDLAALVDNPDTRHYHSVAQRLPAQPECIADILDGYLKFELIACFDAWGQRVAHRKLGAKHSRLAAVG